MSVECCKLRYGDYFPTVATVIELFAGIYWTMVPLGPTPIHSQPGTNNTTSAPAALNSSGGGSTKSNSSVVCITSAILWCIIALVPQFIVYNPKFLANVKSEILFCKHDSLIYYHLVWLMHSSDLFWDHYILRWPSLVLVTCGKYFWQISSTLLSCPITDSLPKLATTFISLRCTAVTQNNKLNIHGMYTKIHPT